MPRIATAFGVLACAGLISMPVSTGQLDATPATPQYTALVTPRFELTYLRGRLLLDGHTRSTPHERRLTDVARHWFGEPSTSFRPLGVVPDYWSRSTVELVAAIAGTQSSTAILTDSRLMIRGVATDGWQQQLESLRSALPNSIELSVKVTPHDATIDIENLCERSMGAFTHGPVNFEESGTRFRHSAYPVLDGVVALADACRSSKIAITGHSDSSGDEASNVELSRLRAQAVAGYIAQRGIEEDRLIVSGAGSAVPVVDNGTRYGRSLNRRIDIRLRP